MANMAKIETDVAALYSLVKAVADHLGISTDVQSVLVQKAEGEAYAAKYWAEGGEGYNQLHGIKPKKKADAEPQAEETPAPTEEPAQEPEPEPTTQPVAEPVEAEAEAGPEVEPEPETETDGLMLSPQRSNKGRASSK